MRKEWYIIHSDLFSSKHLLSGLPKEKIDTKFECYKFPVVEFNQGIHGEKF